MVPVRGEALGVFQIHTIDGSGFADVVSKSLKSMEGIKAVAVNYVTDKVYVSYDPIRISPGRIRRAIADAGVRASRASEGTKLGKAGSRLSKGGAPA